MRAAQDCSKRYGGGIVLLRVDELSQLTYIEYIENIDFRPEKNLDWQKTGRHHLNICRFKTSTFVVIDGYSTTTLFNSIFKKITKIIFR